MMLTSGFHLRNATLRDVPQLQAFQQEAWQHDYADFVPEAYIPIALERYASPEALAKTIEQDHYYLLAEDNQGLCGCLAAVHHNDREAELFWLHVALHCRRQGLGKGLVEELLRRLEPSIQTLYVVTFQKNTTALVFYKTLGFVNDREEIDSHDGVLVHNLRLKRSIYPKGE